MKLSDVAEGVPFTVDGIPGLGGTVLRQGESSVWVEATRTRDETVVTHRGRDDEKTVVFKRTERTTWAPNTEVSLAPTA